MGLKRLFGIKPSSLKRRLLIGGSAIFAGGFFSFATIFYSFLMALNTTSALCVFPRDEAAAIAVSILFFPLVTMSLYIALAAAILYYVNPWEKIRAVGRS